MSYETDSLRDVDSFLCTVVAFSGLPIQALVIESGFRFFRLSFLKVVLGVNSW